MRFKVSEPVNPVVLYERDMQFENLNLEELKDLLRGVKTAFDLAYQRLKRKEFAYARYRLIFSTGTNPDLRYLASPLIGAIQLNQDAGRDFVLPAFRTGYKERLREVWENFEEGSNIGLEASVIGFKDTVPKEVNF